MATTFVAQDYITALQTLLTRQGVNATVKGFQPAGRMEALASGPIVEVQIDDFAVTPSGILRTIDGTLTVTLLVMVPLDKVTSEADAFELAFDVATSLVDEHPDGALPVIKGGPILVTSMQPEMLDGPAGERAACVAVTYEQRLSISRTNQIADPSLTDILLGRYPDVGPGHEPDYKQIVPKEP